MIQRIIIVTGASRGIGKSLSLQTNLKFNENTLFLLMARNKAQLEQTRLEMLNKKSSNIASQNKIATIELDFSKSSLSVSDLSDLIKQSVSGLSLSNLEEFYVFYNHGTLRIATIEMASDWVAQEFQTNVNSVWLLMAAVRQMFPLNLVPTQFHVNFSTLLTTKLLESCSVYSATRCARATMFRCLALEQPFLRVLNYQPGPVFTDMQKQFYDSNTYMYDSYRNDFEEGNLLQPEATVKKLLEIIERNQFENGSTVDYYD